VHILHISQEFIAKRRNDNFWTTNDREK
ncbi:hypothetical protein Gasu_60330, partial [Galdieria sulphuraria]